MKVFHRLLFLVFVLNATALWAQSFPIDKFVRMGNTKLVETSKRLTLSNVAGADSCALTCLNSSNVSWCKSFDYDAVNRTCGLSTSLASDPAQGLSVVGSSLRLDHYSLRQGPLMDFSVIPSASLGASYKNKETGVISNTYRETLTSQTPTQCASACRASTRPWCKSFRYTKPSDTAVSQCAFSEFTPDGNIQPVRSNADFDLYIRHVPAKAGASLGNRRLLVIGMDGMRGDSIACDGCAKPSALLALMKTGAYHLNVLAGGIKIDELPDGTQTVGNEQRSISGPGWGSVLTGHWDDDHGLTDNTLTYRMIKPHVFDLLRQGYPTSTSAVLADWENLSQNMKPYSSKFVRQTAKYTTEGPATIISLLNQRKPPTAIFWHIGLTDIHRANYDPTSSVYQYYISMANELIETVLNHLTSRPSYQNEEWLIVVTSDHGGIRDGHNHQTYEEKNSFVILNNTYKKTGAKSYCTGDLSLTRPVFYHVDAITPHILDFFGLANPTEGRKHPSCNFTG